jgi:hypothetical protein
VCYSQFRYCDRRCAARDCTAGGWVENRQLDRPSSTVLGLCKLKHVLKNVATTTETQRISRTVTPGPRPPLVASRAIVLDLVEGDTAVGSVFAREPQYVLTDGIAGHFIAASTEGDGLPGQVALADLDQSVAVVDHGRAGHDLQRGVDFQ